MNQKIISKKESYKELEKIFKQIGCHKYLLVCDSSFHYLNIDTYLNSISIPFVLFNDFTSNPLYEDVQKGIDILNNNYCDTIVAIGGGSSIDVAKCIKLFSKMKKNENYLKQSFFDSSIPLIAIPTTAGTGSESTHYAVIYYNNEKQSITHESILPNYAILESSFLKTLPIYQKKCTLLDALCQAIESWWSINSTDESKKYSKIAIEKILKHMDNYILLNDEVSQNEILIAANYAGRAINITQTTAAHAMSYKLTSLYHLPHGHAVALCLPKVWNYMIHHLDKCIDERGRKYLNQVFYDIAKSMNYKTPMDAIQGFEKILEKYNIEYPISCNRNKDVETLTKSINLTRLRNNPIKLEDDVIQKMYQLIVYGE